MWRCSCSQAYGTPEMLKNTSKDFPDMPQNDADNTPLAAVAPALTSTNSWLFFYINPALTLLLNYLHSTERISASCLSSALFFSDRSSQGNLKGHFSDHVWIFHQRNWRLWKIAHKSFSGCHSKREETVQLCRWSSRGSKPLHRSTHVYTLILIWGNQNCFSDIPEMQ